MPEQWLVALNAGQGPLRYQKVGRQFCTALVSQRRFSHARDSQSGAFLSRIAIVIEIVDKIGNTRLKLLVR